MTMQIYVAAPYADAPMVRAVHVRLVALGLAFTSTWAEAARGAEDFSALTPEGLRAAALENNRGIDDADAMLVLARDGAGGEMFAEARYALTLGIPVLWCGRRILSSWRDGVVICDDVDAALATLVDGARVGS